MNTELIKLEEDETILIEVRKHWFILFSQTLGLLFAALLPFLLLIGVSIVNSTTDVFSQFNINVKLISFISGTWLLLVWIALFGIWTDYNLDMWIITNKRIISIDQQGFFRRSVSSFRFERLQDITIEIKGIIETLLDFGAIKADTAGHDPFIIKNIPNPRGVKSLILEHADQVSGAAFPKDFI